MVQDISSQLNNKQILYKKDITVFCGSSIFFILYHTNNNYSLIVFTIR